MPAWSHFFTAALIIINACSDPENKLTVMQPDSPIKKIEKTIRGISLPPGFDYVESTDTAYTTWLLDIILKKSNTVYLYNGKLTPNQDVHYDVLDIDIWTKDLVQCADAAMKLKSDYLYEKHKYSDLNFITTSGDSISFQNWLNGTRWKEKDQRLISYRTSRQVTDTNHEYNRFMELVYSYCGSYSLSKQLKRVANLSSIQPGDIFIEGGFPGHAVTVMAVAKNAKGKCIFLLSQGYMPAQDIHILKNYGKPGFSPWYDLDDVYPLYTPQWQFEKGSLKRW
jgi:hypothetical protein